jgi:hypothetical protein
MSSTAIFNEVLSLEIYFSTIEADYLFFCTSELKLIEF